MVDIDCRIPSDFQLSSNFNALLSSTVLLFANLLNTLKYPITQLDDHYYYISERHDRAFQIGSAVQNNLKSKWFYANDDKNK